MFIADAVSATISGMDTQRLKYKAEYIDCLKKNFTTIENTKDNCFLLHTLDANGYRLTSPITIEYRLEDNEIIVEYKPLGIFEYAENLKTAVQNVQEYILDLYDELVSLPDNKLTPELVKQKRELKQLISAE